MRCGYRGSPSRINAAPVFLHAFPQGFEIQLFQRALRLDLAAHVRDQQLAIDQINIGFDTTEAMIERVQQRTLVLIVVMRVNASERPGRVLRENGQASKPKAAQQAWNQSESRDSKSDERPKTSAAR